MQWRYGYAATNEAREALAETIQVPELPTHQNTVRL